MINIAILDNGIENKLVKKYIKNIDLKLESNYLNGQIEQVSFPHGTMVVLIIEKYMEESEISSIRILDNEGKGLIRDLKIALKWCLNNKIDIVNLSLGTTHFQDRKILLNTINYYANRGLRIVAAISNNGFFTYPASFSNVIGVISSQIDQMLHFDYNHLGIDIKAQSEHNVSIKNKIIVTQASNSYAAPYVTSMISHMLKNNVNISIGEIKQLLNEKESSNIRPELPDWISYATILNHKKISKSSYYFKIKNMNKISNLNIIDTIIVDSKEELQKNIYRNKHMVYIGNEQVDSIPSNQFFWSKNNRIIQILNSKEGKSNFTIPVVVCEINAEIDEILVLSVLREAFSKDGYNIYAASFLIDSVLYDLEYIPREMMDECKIKKLYDFLYWQAYYKQSDGILMAVHSEYSNKNFLNVDLKIAFDSEQENKKITIICNDIIRYIQTYKDFRRDDILDIYLHIKTILTEDECE